MGWLKNAVKMLTDKAMKDMVPIFVDAESTKTDDHKCGNCNMRVEMPEGPAQCTIVAPKRGISLTRGTCAWWAEGEAAKEEGIHEFRMSAKMGGYVEGPSDDFKIQCGTCSAIDGTYCKLWQGEVKESECCMVYGNPEVDTPEGETDEDYIG